MALQREGKEQMEAAQRLQAELAEQAELIKRERHELEQRESQLVTVSFAEAIVLELMMVCCCSRKDLILLASVESIRRTSRDQNSPTPTPAPF